MSLLNQPKQINFLSPLHFRFVLQRAPYTDFFCTKANIPDISLAVAKQSTPFQNVPLPGHKLEWGELKITFHVDENMKNYLELFNWLTAIGLKDNFDNYAALASAGPTSPQKVLSDGSLILLSGVKSPILSVTYSNMFPIHLGNIDFDETNRDVEYVSCDAIFKYQAFAIESLISD